MMQRGQDNGRNYFKENMENAVYYNESIFIYRRAACCLLKLFLLLLVITLCMVAAVSGLSSQK